jgi:hypothetical protein
MVIRKNVENRHSKRNISERKKDYVVFEEEFGHLEGDTIVGIHHAKVPSSHSLSDFQKPLSP